MKDTAVGEGVDNGFGEGITQVGVEVIEVVGGF